MLQAHDRLGDFEIIRLLGKGGMGEVYEARQFNPERSVALKILAPWLADDDEALQRFWREADVPAKLDHPNIVRIISTGKTRDGVAYFTMHLVRGISIAEMIKRTTSSPSSEIPTRTVASGDTPSSAPPASSDIPPASPAPDFDAATNPPLAQAYRHDPFTTLARIGVQIARALAFAHQQGFLHRDIKPSNVMIDHHDHVYLVDFGLTRGLTPTGDVTQPGVLVGTPWYMSPEQSEGKPVDARSDIYSLGVTLFEMATRGLGPFTASRDDKASVLAQVRSGQTMPLRLAAPGIPFELERIILKAIQLKPGKRQGTAAELARELEAFLGLESRKPQASADDKAQTPRPSRRKIWVAASVLGLVVALAITLSAFMPDRRPHGPVNGDPADHAGKFDGRQAYPEYLRSQPMNVALGLLQANNVPLWNERLFGTAKHAPFPDKLILLNNDPGPALLGIAEPDRQCFDFSVDVSKNQGGGPNQNRVGVVFGWRRSPPAGVFPRHFVVELDDEPSEKNPIGQVKLGTGWLARAKGKENGDLNFEWYRPLKGGKGVIPLSKGGAFHTIEVRVRRDTATVVVNQRELQVISLAWLRESDESAAANLDPRGTVGLWAMNGAGRFRKASITLIADLP